MPEFYKLATSQLCIFLFLLFQVNPSAAQPNFSIEHYTSENGLPQNSIKSIAADADGFIWLATEDGLTRFDGRKFKISEDSSMGVHSKRVISILPGQRNHIYSNRLDVAYVLFASDEMSKICNGTAALVGNDLELQRGKMTALRAKKKDIYFISGLPERWQRTMLPELPTLVTDNYAGGSFFLCTASTVAYYKDWGEQYVVQNDAPERLNYFTLGERLYYFDGRASLVQIFDGRRVAFPVKGDILQSKGFANQKSQVKIYWNNNADQAFFYFNRQLFELVQKSDGSLSTNLLTTGFDVISENIDVIFYDRESKKVFAGSSTKGLFVISIPQFETIRVSGTDRPNIFYAHVPYDDNSILTPTGVVVGKDAITGKIIDRRITEVENIQTDDRRFLFKDRQEHIWVKNGYTLTRLNQRNQIVGKWKFKNGVKAVCQGNALEFWIGVYDEGIFKIDAQSFSSEPERVGGELAKHITCMAFKNSNELWVGTLSGLYTVNLQNGQTNLVPETSGFDVKSVRADNEGKFWMTALDRGLMLLNSDNQIVSFPLDEDKFLASAHYALNDGNGFVWVPTNRGLFQMKLSDLLEYADQQKDQFQKNDSIDATKAEGRLFYAYHSMNEGFATNEFNGGCSSCGLTLRNGYVSLPSIDGLVWFRPKQISRSVSNTGIILDDVFFKGARIEVSGDTVNLPLRPENVRFDFATAHFGNGHNLHVTYALAKEGAAVPPSAWQPVDNNNEITIRYSSLAPGSYLLLIRKDAGFGLDNVVVKRVHVVVPEIWYETGWAMLIFAACLLAVLVFGVRLYNEYRLKTIQNEKDELERVVAMRTNTLQATLTELDEQVHVMSRMIASISHDVQTPLSQITVASEDIPDLVSERRLDDISKVAAMIASTSVRTGKLLNDLLNYVKIQVYGKRVRFDTINLADLIEEKLGLFESAIKHQDNEVIVDVPADLTVRSDYQLLSIVIHNLIDNAVKYTRRGRIAFRAQANGNVVELILANSGLPLPQERMDFMNSNSATEIPSHSQQQEKGNNLGLIIVKEVSHLIGIRIYATQTDTVNFHILFDK